MENLKNHDHRRPDMNPYSTLKDLFMESWQTTNEFL